MTWKLKPNAPFSEIRNNHDELYVYKISADNTKNKNGFNSAMNDPAIKEAKKWANSSAQGSWASSIYADSTYDIDTGKVYSCNYLVLTDPEDAMMWELQNPERLKMLMIPSNMNFFYKYID